MIVKKDWFDEQWNRMERMMIGEEYFRLIQKYRLKCVHDEMTARMDEGY